MILLLRFLVSKLLRKCFPELLCVFLQFFAFEPCMKEGFNVLFYINRIKYLKINGTVKINTKRC